MPTFLYDLIITYHLFTFRLSTWSRASGLSCITCFMFNRYFVNYFNRRFSHFDVINNLEKLFLLFNPHFQLYENDNKTTWLQACWAVATAISCWYTLEGKQKVVWGRIGTLQFAGAELKKGWKRNILNIWWFRLVLRCWWATIFGW